MENISGGDLFNLIVWGILFLILISKFVQSICLVPTKSAYIVERFGLYYKTLGAGFHALIPFVDQVAFKQNLKEETIDVPPQECFSKDEVKVEVDGVIYISVTDPVKASYGIDNYRFGAIQLAQTTTRAVIGTIDLDRTFEERDLISSKVVAVLDKAGDTWGIRVHRYEIKNISPPETVKDAMEKQVTAERERRAILAKSEGEKQSCINMSEGKKMELINLSEGEMQKRINIAEGKAVEIIAIAEATANSIEKLAKVIAKEGGVEAIKLQMAEKYLSKLGHLAKKDTHVILPANLIDFDGWLKKVGLSLDSQQKI